MQALTYNKRETNIELLRILCICGVILLHYCNIEIGKGLLYVDTDSLNYYCMHFIISLAICAVNLFILISGYFMVNNVKRSLMKPLKLIVQVILVQLFLYLANVFLFEKTFAIKAILRALIPANYFVILYIAVYITSPYINKLMAMLSLKQNKRFILIIFLIFSVWPTIVDLIEEAVGHKLMGLSSIGMYGSQYGYSYINFLLMYCIGAFLKRYDFSSIDNKRLYVSFILNNLLINILSQINNTTAWEYCNPLIVLEAILVFLIFNKIKLQNEKINFLAKSVFSVFLLHFSFINKLNISYFVNSNLAVMILHMMFSCIGIYLVCFIFDIFYKKFENFIFNLKICRCSFLSENFTLLQDK